MDPELREALQQIAEPGVKLADHRDLVSKLPYPHAIEPLDPDPKINAMVEHYTCFMYALDIADSEPVIKIARVHDKIFPGADLIEHVMGTCLARVSKSARSDGDLVIYFRGGRPAHAGKADADRVVSKWGVGLMWRHPVFEVPSSYGETVGLFRQPGREKVEEEFVEFAAGQVGANTIERLLAS